MDVRLEQKGKKKGKKNSKKADIKKKF